MNPRYSRRALALIVLFATISFRCTEGSARNEDVAAPPPPLHGACIAEHYAWHSSYSASNALARRIATPTGYARIPTATNTFADWLRGLPLTKGKGTVRDYQGRPLSYQGGHVAVVAMDVGERDLQQCADTVMRFRAEHLFSLARYDAIAFSFVSGDTLSYADYVAGKRPQFGGRRVTYRYVAPQTPTRKSLHAYLTLIYMYANTYSLTKDLARVPLAEARIGDVFIQGGFPGHAVIVVDMAENAEGEKAMLLVQGFMPAQDAHVLRNPSDDELSPWYPVAFGETLTLPVWEFTDNNLYRFR